MDGEYIRFCLLHNRSKQFVASSAEHMSSGFLGHERDKAAVQLHKGDESTQPTTFLCDAIDDFQGDVLNGPLSKRGWVLQERALARRIIFFTNN